MRHYVLWNWSAPCTGCVQSSRRSLHGLLWSSGSLLHRTDVSCQPSTSGISPKRGGEATLFSRATPTTQTSSRTFWSRWSGKSDRELIPAEQKAPAKESEEGGVPREGEESQKGKDPKSKKPKIDVTKGLYQFFEKDSEWGQNETKCGREWTVAELRLKSNQDLHKLWKVLDEHVMPQYMNARKPKEYEQPDLDYDAWVFQKYWKEKQHMKRRDEEDDWKRRNKLHKYIYQY